MYSLSPDSDLDSDSDGEKPLLSNEHRAVDSSMAQQHMGNMLSSYVAAKGGAADIGFFGDGIVDEPENLVIPMHYSLDARDWLSEASQVFQELPLQVKFLSCLLFLLPLALWTVAEGLFISLRSTEQYVVAATDHAAMRYIYGYMQSHQFAIHALLSFFPLLCLFLFTSAAMAVFKQLLHNKDAFSLNENTTKEAVIPFWLLSPKASPFYFSFVFALAKLFVPGTLLFITSYLPFLFLRFIFIGSIVQLNINSSVLFAVIYTIYACLQFVLQVYTLHVIPVFVSHPSFHPVYIYQTSFKIVHTQFLQNAQFFLTLLLLLIIGACLFVVGLLPILVILTIVMSIAQRSIFPSQAWENKASFHWQDKLPMFLHLSCPPAELYHKSSGYAEIYNNKQRNIDESDDDGYSHVQYNTTTNNNNSTSMHSIIDFHSEESTTGISFHEEELDL